MSQAIFTISSIDTFHYDMTQTQMIDMDET